MSTAVATKNGSMPHPPPPASTPPKFVASQLIDLSAIEPDPHNPRKDFPKEAMNELISSVMLHGVRSPIEVRQVGLNGNALDGAGLSSKRFRIVFGERRYRAAKAAGLKQIPAIVRTLTDIEAAEVQLDENLKRAELSPLEVAGGYQRQLELGRTMDEVCERAGKKRTQVYAMVHMLKNLGPEGRKSLGEERISTSVAQLVARVPKSLQPKALSLVEAGENFPAATFREAEAALEQHFTVDLKGAPFDPKDAKLCPAAGGCDACPKRTGNTKELFPDVKSPDVCTDRSCYDAKVLADARRAVEAKGWKMLEPMPAADELFWNAGRGPVKDEAAWVEPKSTCLEDAQSRPYEQLLTTEQLKKLVRVALDADGKPRQLLERAGLLREVKKGGHFKERRKSEPKEKAAPKDSAERVAVAAPDFGELVDLAVMGKLVEVAEKKGPTPAMLRLLARELLTNASDVYRRRKLVDPGAGFISEKEFLKAFGALPASKLFGVVFEAALSGRYLDGFEPVADELGVDVEKVSAEMEAEAEAKAHKAAPGDKAAERARRKAAAKADPLDSPAVAKAKAKKVRAKKPTPAHKRVTFSNGKHHLSAAKKGGKK